MYQKEKEKTLKRMRNQYGSVGTRPITFNQKSGWEQFPRYNPPSGPRPQNWDGKRSHPGPYELMPNQLPTKEIERWVL
jgi:hypothetical protein